MIMVAHDQARQIPISLDQLIGSGNWGRTQDQVLMEDQAIEQVRQYCTRVWEKIEVKGQAFLYFKRRPHLPRETIPAGTTSYQSGYPCHQEEKGTTEDKMVGWHH